MLHVAFLTAQGEIKTETNSWYFIVQVAVGLHRLSMGYWNRTRAEYTPTVVNVRSICRYILWCQHICCPSWNINSVAQPDVVDNGGCCLTDFVVFYQTCEQSKCSSKVVSINEIMWMRNYTPLFISPSVSKTTLSVKDWASLQKHWLTIIICTQGENKVEFSAHWTTCIIFHLVITNISITFHVVIATFCITFDLVITTTSITFHALIATFCKHISPGIYGARRGRVWSGFLQPFADSTGCWLAVPPLPSSVWMTSAGLAASGPASSGGTWARRSRRRRFRQLRCVRWMLSVPLVPA